MTLFDIEAFDMEDCSMRPTALFQSNDRCMLLP